MPWKEKVNIYVVWIIQILRRWQVNSKQCLQNDCSSSSTLNQDSGIGREIQKDAFSSDSTWNTERQAVASQILNLPRQQRSELSGAELWNKNVIFRCHVGYRTEGVHCSIPPVSFSTDGLQPRHRLPWKSQGDRKWSCSFRADDTA